MGKEHLSSVTGVIPRTRSSEQLPPRHVRRPLEVPMTAVSNRPAAGFADLGLDQALLSALDALGYEEPTPIQRETIPSLLEGRDLLGQAATGTGKTAAFALPLLQRLAPERSAVGALILVPTRELAMQ